MSTVTLNVPGLSKCSTGPVPGKDRGHNTQQLRGEVSSGSRRAWGPVTAFMCGRWVVASEPGDLPPEDGIELQQCAQSSPPKTNRTKTFQGEAGSSGRLYTEVGLTRWALLWTPALLPSLRVGQKDRPLPSVLWTRYPRCSGPGAPGDWAPAGQARAGEGKLAP